MITREEALHLFNYDNESDTLTWKNHAHPSRIGTVAGYRNPGGRDYFRFKKKRYKIDDIVVLIKFGAWPKDIRPLTKEYVRFIFDYDKDRNVLIWKRPHRHKYIGKDVLPKGRQIGLNRAYFSIRHVINIHQGIVTNPLDAVANISNDKGNLIGVYDHGRRFRAGIKTKGKYKHLGTFDTAKEAHDAYLKAYHEKYKGRFDV